jgi:hypothetical protein
VSVFLLPSLYVCLSLSPFPSYTTNIYRSYCFCVSGETQWM